MSRIKKNHSNRLAKIGELVRSGNPAAALDVALQGRELSAGLAAICEEKGASAVTWKVMYQRYLNLESKLFDLCEKQRKEG